MRAQITFDVKLKDGKTPVIYKLKLTAGAKAKLDDLYPNIDRKELIMRSIGDFNIAIEIMNLALNYAGNENPTHDGEEFLDILADEGYSDFDLARVFAGIGWKSGIFDLKAKGIIEKRVAKLEREYLQNLDEEEKALEDDEEEEQEQEPDVKNLTTPEA